MVKKTHPPFSSEDEERAFWDTHDATDYFDMDNPVLMDFSLLKPSTERISIRLPKSLLQSIKTLAQSKDIPYQSFMKVLLDRGVKQELRAV